MSACLASVRALRRPFRGLARALAIGALACVVLLAAAFGGMPYNWCVPMAHAQLHCCCHPQMGAGEEPNARQSADAPAVEAACCEGRHLASLPPADSVAHADLSIPPPLGVLLLVLAVAAWLAAAPPLDGRVLERLRRARAGPEPPLFALHRAYLN